VKRVHLTLEQHVLLCVVPAVTIEVVLQGAVSISTCGTLSFFIRVIRCVSEPKFDLGRESSGHEARVVVSELVLLIWIF
jgi:hypothetical protein